MFRKPIQSKKAGFTLTEVVVSIMLFTVGLTAASSTLIVVFKKQEISKNLMAATSLAQKEMEQVKSKDFSAVVSETEDFGTIQGYAQFRRTKTVTPNVDNTLKSVVIEVVGPKNQAIKLETLVSKR